MILDFVQVMHYLKEKKVLRFHLYLQIMAGMYIKSWLDVPLWSLHPIPPLSAEAGPLLGLGPDPPPPLLPALLPRLRGHLVGGGG